MIGIMRKYKQSIIIKGVFGIIVFSFIGTIFLVWGKGEKGLSGKEFAVRVGKTKISFDEYQRYLYRLRNIYSQLYGKTLTPEMEQQMGLKMRALENLIDNALVRIAAKEMGIEITKDEVEKEIASVPAFQKNGVFNFQLYQQRLREERMTPSYFEENVKDDLLIRKTKQKVLEKVKVSDDEALNTFRKLNDRITLQYYSFCPSNVKGEVKLTEQDLENYLQMHQEQFRTEERISLSYIVIDPEKIAAGQKISDEEAQTFYQKNIDRFQGKDGFIPFMEVKERAKAAALKEKGAKVAYEMAADTVNKCLKAADINLAASTLGLQVNETPMFTQRAPARQFAGETELIKRSFALKEGELEGPVETLKGIYIFKIKERQPAVVPPLAKIRGRIVALASEERAKDVAHKKAEEALAKLEKGISMPNMQIIDQFSYSARGEVPGIGSSPDLMEAVYGLSKTSPLARTTFKIGDCWYVIRLKDRIELNKEEFPKQKERIRQELLPGKQQKALKDWLKDLRGKTKIDINPSLTSNEQP